MRYNTIYYNDTANAPGISVSVYLQGCDHRCNGCFNPETWDFEGGQELTIEIIADLFENKINANGIKRNLCILGGEPLHPNNIFTTYMLTQYAFFYNVPVYIWTGYTMEELLDRENYTNEDELELQILTSLVFRSTNYIIDGKFNLAERDITLKMRGSRNQRIFELKNNQAIDVTEQFWQTKKFMI